MPLTETEQDELTAAMLGVTERYSGADPIDLQLVRELAAEARRFIEARERALVVLPVILPNWLPPIGWGAAIERARQQIAEGPRQ